MDDLAGSPTSGSPKLRQATQENVAMSETRDKESVPPVHNDLSAQNIPQKPIGRISRPPDRLIEHMWNCNIYKHYNYNI